jgi:ArsR family transcriptional regulator
VAREQAEQWAACRQDQLRLRRLLAEKQSLSQAFFAGAAAEWDQLRGELYGQAFSQAAMMALIPPDLVVADLGCGAGPVAAALAPCVKQLIGVDNSPAMLKAARQRTAGMANVDLRRGNLEHLPIDDAACDAALLLLALTYVAEPLAVVREMSRILKPGGRAIVVDLLPHDREDFARRMGQNRLGFSADEIKSLLSAGGFDEPVARALPPEANVKGPALFLAVARRGAGDARTGGR